MINRTGSAVWSGGLKDGKGTVSTQSGVLRDTQYGFSSRFEQGAGTNPEELIAAAHAGCFTMALSAQLEQAGLKASRLETTASVSLNKADGGFEIPAIHLTLVAQVPGATEAQFQDVALKAKEGCPVSKLMKANITMDAKLRA